MRYLFLTMMMVGMLYSAQQRQIIVGSFSIERNALFYSVDVQKQIDEDKELKTLMKKYSLKLDYKAVGAYHVVSISPFKDNPSLFDTINKVQKHYPAAYAINFPAYASMSPAPVVEVVVDEIVEPIAKVQPAEVKVEEVKPKVVEPVKNDVKYEAPVVKKPTPPAVPKETASKSTFVMSDMISLALLLLAIIGFVVYKKKMKKEDEA